MCAEVSRPWPGTTVGDDAGPYSAENWYDVWGALMRSGVDFGRSADYNIGVFYTIGNLLEPTESGTDIDVDTGASLVDGLYHENDASKSIDVGSASARPAANPRIDYIVVRKNYQAAVTYTPANSTATVGPRTARITVIRGTEAAVPVAPSLTQDTTRTTYWDIPLATVQISTGGVLSNFTDMREYVGEKVFKNILPGTRNYEYNSGSGTAYPLDSSIIEGYKCDNNDESFLYTDFILPAGYIDGSLFIKSIVIPNSSGTIYASHRAWWGECGESYDQNTYDDGYQQVALTIDENNCVMQFDLEIPDVGSAPTADDIVKIEFFRDGDNVLDTLSDWVGHVGFLVEYRYV